MNKVAGMLKENIDDILNYLKYPITNALAEYNLSGLVI
jgi:transposase